MPSKFYPNWDFWFEVKPSGNPGHQAAKGSAKPHELRRAVAYPDSAGAVARLHNTRQHTTGDVDVDAGAPAVRAHDAAFVAFVGQVS
jgi:hypothetical protein